MKKIKWPPEKAAALLDLARAGLSRREIAARMALDIRAITTKLLAMGVYAPLNAAGHRRALDDHLCTPHFPRFEDVTRTEARAIARGAPPSARWPRDYSYSLTGNAAEMCAL